MSNPGSSHTEPPHQHASSGERFARGQDQDQRWAVIADPPERQGVTGHNVRYVLIAGLAGAVVGLTTVLVMSLH